MQSVSQSYLEQFNAARRTTGFEVSIIAQSNFNLPEWAEPSATASSEKSAYFAPANAIDGERAEPVRYWVLGHGCKLGHGWCLLGPLSRHNPGWWSANKSDSNGSFATPPWLEIAYAQAVSANFVRVVTTTVYPGVATFTLKVWYQGAGSYTTLGQYTFGAMEASKTISLGEPKQIAKIKVEINSTKAANQHARLTELEPVLEWSPASTPVSAYVTDYSVKKSSGVNSPGKPAAPGVGANSLSITFSRDVKNLSVPQENMIIILRQGFGSDLVDVGRFVVMEPPDETEEGWSCQAYSSLQLAKFHALPDLVFHNRKTSQILRYILTGLGIPEDMISFHLSEDPNWTWYIVPGDDASSVLTTMADHFGVAIYQLENSNVVVRSSYGSSVFTLTDSYIKGMSLVPGKTINAVVVHYSIVKKTAEDDIWNLDSDISLPASSSLKFVFPLQKSPAVDIKSPAWTDKSGGVEAYVQISSWRCNGFYLNLTLTNTTGSTRIIPRRAISLRGTPIVLSPERVVEANNQASIKKLGRRDFETNLYCASDAVAQGVATRMLNYLNRAATVYQIDLNRPIPHLQLRDVITLNSTFFGVNKAVVVTNISLDKGSSKIECIDKEAVSG